MGKKKHHNRSLFQSPGNHDFYRDNDVPLKMATRFRCVNSEKNHPDPNGEMLRKGDVNRIKWNQLDELTE